MRLSGHKQNPGTALVAVIWLIGLLSLMVVATIRVVGFDVDVTSAKIQGFRAWQLAEMGIALGVNPKIEKGDPLLIQQFEDEGFEVRLESEGSKFNINYILQNKDNQLLENMFIDWGMEVEDAETVIDHLADWVDSNDEEELKGAEVEAYEELGRINQPFNRPFYSLDEMRMVLGMDLVESYQPNWRNWFTVWSSGLLDVNEADAEMIAMAAEVRYEDADIIPETVRGADGIKDTDDDFLFGSAAEALALIGVDSSLRPDITARFGVNETTTRIVSIGTSAGVTRKIIMVVRNRTGQPAILERTEEVIP